MTRTTAQQIYARELRAVLAGLTPNCPGGKFSGQQIVYARAEARRRTLKALEAERGRGRVDNA